MPNQETPSGAVNGTNAVFTCVGTITNEILFVDRLVQISGSDYTISGSTITFLSGSIPQSGATIRISYTSLPVGSGVVANLGSTTLGAIRTSAQQRADMANSSFVSTSEWNGYINASYQELYDLLVQHYGDDYFVATPYQFTTDGVNDKYPLPTDFYKLLGFDIQLIGSPTGWVPLTEFPFAHRNRFAILSLQPQLGLTNLKYRLSGGNAWLAPLPTSGLVFRIFYVPRVSILVQDTDIVDGVSGWEEYIIVDACIKALAKEESDVSVFGQQKQALMDRIVRAASHRNAGEPHTMTDVYATGNPWDGGYGAFGGW